MILSTLQGKNVNERISHCCTQYRELDKKGGSNHKWRLQCLHNGGYNVCIMLVTMFTESWLQCLHNGGCNVT